MRRREKSECFSSSLCLMYNFLAVIVSPMSPNPQAGLPWFQFLWGDPRLRVRITPPAPLSSPTSGMLELVYTGSQEQAVKYLGILQAGC